MNLRALFKTTLVATALSLAPALTTSAHAQTIILDFSSGTISPTSYTQDGYQLTWLTDLGFNPVVTGGLLTMPDGTNGGFFISRLDAQNFDLLAADYSVLHAYANYNADLAPPVLNISTLLISNICDPGYISLDLSGTIDNIVLRTVPTPGAFALFGTAGLLVTRRRCR